MNSKKKDFRWSQKDFAIGLQGLIEIYLARNKKIINGEEEKLQEVCKLLKEYRKGDMLEHLASRKTFAPFHVVVTAYLYDPNKKLVYLLFHKKNQHWTGVGGHVEFEDSSLRQAMMREIKEEINLIIHPQQYPDEVPFDMSFHSIPKDGRKKEPTHHHLDLRSIIRLDSKQIQILRPNLIEIDSGEWFTTDRMLHLDDEMKRLGNKMKIFGY